MLANNRDFNKHNCMAEDLSGMATRLDFIHFVETHLAGGDDVTILIEDRWPWHSVRFVKSEPDEDAIFHTASLRVSLGDTVFDAMLVAVEDATGEFEFGNNYAEDYYPDTEEVVARDIARFTNLVRILLQED